MNDAPELWTDETDEDATMRLLRLAGPRPDAPARRGARVRTAVHAQWQMGTRRRIIRKRAMLASIVFASAAALLLFIGRINLAERDVVPLGQAVAVVEQLDGHSTLSRNDAVRIGEWIETSGGARIGLRFANGTSVRLDADSRARALSARVIELSAGAVYVDTGRDDARFEVRTAIATARDVGTQFEVRLAERTLRLRVRTGIVELKDPRRSVSGPGGTEITLSDSGAVSRPIALHGSEWEWTAAVAPALEIEGLALAAFLERTSREYGWRVEYADAALAREASGIILHGSVSGLTPKDAVAVAIATSGLSHRLENGELVVMR